jgi:hypothetical protein
VKSPWALKTTILIALFVAVVIFVWSKRASADPLLQTSIGHTIIRAPGYALDLTFVWPQGRAEASCGATLVEASIENNNPLPWQMGVHCGMANHYKKLWAGLGVVYLQNVDYTNPAHLNFNPWLQYRFTEHVGACYAHWSNAGTVQPNRGRDMVFVCARL